MKKCQSYKLNHTSNFYYEKKNLPKCIDTKIILAINLHSSSTIFLNSHFAP